MSYQVFISYRRKDQPAPALAEWLYNLLVPEVGASGVFFDRDELEEGDDFPERLQRAVEDTVVFIALIGPEWNPMTQRGERRLDNPRDFVRREVARSLECKEADGRRLILPVLFDGAPFPLERELPDCLHSLTKYTGCTVGSPYQEGLCRVVQSVVRKLDEFDSIPAEEKWILQQIGNILPADRHRIRQIGRELKERFTIIPAVPVSARSLARALYLVGLQRCSVSRRSGVMTRKSTRCSNYWRRIGSNLRLLGICRPSLPIHQMEKWQQSSVNTLNLHQRRVS